MEFKNQKQVDEYINNLGVFLNSEELCMKTDNNNYIVIDDKKNKIIDYVNKNTSPFSEVSVSFPIIDFKVFNDYNNREDKIIKHKIMIDEIQKSKKFLKKGWRLIRLKKTHLDKSNKKIKYLFYDFKKKICNPIKEEFLDNKDLNNAYEVKNIVIIRNINKETFDNEFADAYQIELKKWEKIPIYDIGELNG